MFNFHTLKEKCHLGLGLGTLKFRQLILNKSNRIHFPSKNRSRLMHVMTFDFLNLFIHLGLFG